MDCLFFLHRTNNIKIKLDNYKIYSAFWFDELSILNIMENIFVICTILKILETLYNLWIIPDKQSSVFNPKPPVFFFDRLSRDQKFFSV